jgi:RNA polymerase sigma-70 factor, ECF subfamily
MGMPFVIRRLQPFVDASAPAREAAAHEGTEARVAYASFEDLYNAAFPKVYGFIRCQVASTETAQELVSRIFLKAYRHRDRMPTDDGAMQWVFRIAHTTLIDYWRVEKRRERASLPLQEIAELPSATRSHDSVYERKQQISDLLQVVGDLGDDDRELLTLKFAGHRTNREIAGILHLSEGAVSMRLLRALRHLRQRLRRMGWE